MTVTEQKTTKSARETGKKIFWFIFRIALAVGIITFLIHNKIGQIAENLKDFNYWWLLPAFGGYYIHFLIGSWRWWKLTQVLDYKLSYWEALNLTMKAFFFSLVIPGGAIGGDLAKVGFLTSRSEKGKKVEGAFTILMDRITGMLALFALAIVVTIVSIPLLMEVNTPEIYKMCGLEDCPDVIRTFKYIAIAGIIGLCLSGIMACVVLFMHRQLEKIPLIKKLFNWIDSHSHGTVSRMEAAIDLYRDKLGLLSGMVVLSLFFIHLNMVFIVFCLCKGLGMCLAKPLSLLSAVILGNITGLIPFTPSGIGFRDYTIIKLLEVGGAHLDKAQSAAILFTALIITANISGGLFYIFCSKKKK